MRVMILVADRTDRVLTLKFGVTKECICRTFRTSIEKNEISTERFKKMWQDIGRPQKLKEVNSA